VVGVGADVVGTAGVGADDVVGADVVVGTGVGTGVGSDVVGADDVVGTGVGADVVGTGVDAADVVGSVVGPGACAQKTPSSGTTPQTISLIQATTLLTRAKTSGLPAMKKNDTLCMFLN
jgi:hypothetical protein